MQDDGSVLAHAKQEVAIGVGQNQDHRVRIGCGDVADVVEHSALGFVGALLGFGAIKTELHSRRIKGCAILKLDTFAQFEGEGFAVSVHGPTFGQQWRDGTIDIDFGQAFKNVVVHHFTNGGGWRSGGV